MINFVTSDIHSFFDLFHNALLEKGFDETDPNHRLIVCGDFFDRGPDPLSVNSYLQHLLGIGRCVVVKGNHESLLEELLARGFPKQHDLTNGTAETVKKLCAIPFTPFDEACDVARKVVKNLLLRCVDYFETKNYIFVHGWIPSHPKWREAFSCEWEEARWTNGIRVGLRGEGDPAKIIICGHWHCSYGHARLFGTPEFGEGAVFSPFYSDNLIAIDGCTAESGKVNVIKIEDEDL